MKQHHTVEPLCSQVPDSVPKQTHASLRSHTEDIMFFQKKCIREAMFTFEKNSFPLP